MKTTWREDLAWAAGFFDGEGYTGVKKHRKRLIPRIGITQLDRRVLDRFRAVVGVGHVTGPYLARGHKHALHSYETSGCHRVRAVIVMLWFALGEIKREQATRVMRAVDASWLANPKTAKTHCKYGHTLIAYRTRKRCRTCETNWSRNLPSRHNARWAAIITRAAASSLPWLEVA